MCFKINFSAITSKSMGFLLTIFSLYLFSYSHILQLDTIKAFIGLLLKTTLSTIIVYACIALIRNTVLKTLILVIFAVLFTLTLYLNTKFGSISTGIISATIDTNPAEAFEYISTSGLSWQLFMIVIFLLVMKLANSARVKVSRLLLIPFFCITGLFLKNAYVSELPSAYLINIFPEVKMLSLVKETFELRALENKPIYSEWKNVTIKDEKFNYVVILGESAQKKAFSFYGNKVRTTEKIADLKGWTLISDPISPATQTRYSVIRLLSINDKKEVNQNLNIIDLAKLAGMETYWFSNQGSFGAHDTPITRLGKRADNTTFHNIGFTKTKNDNVLINDLKKGLADGSNKGKVFFLHTIGSHVDFCQRLNGSQLKAFPPEVGSNQIECYNNSIYQTFEFIKEIKSILQARNRNFKIIYLSDHGLVDIEEPPYKTHGAGHFFKREAVEVPFIFISNIEEKGKVINKTYYLRDFPHTFAVWASISADQIDIKKAVDNEQLTQEPYVVDHAQKLQYFP